MAVIERPVTAPTTAPPEPGAPGGDRSRGDDGTAGSRRPALRRARRRERSGLPAGGDESRLASRAGPRTPRRRRADRICLGLLVAFPFAVSGALTLGGRVMLLGDNYDQNYPLRVLAGEILRQGRLPAFDPLLWSGTPLLAGWNAGAMFPATWLFAVLSPVTAWMLGLALTYATCGAGTYLLSRRFGCQPLAAFAAAVAFTYTGFMSGQIVHIGLVQGTAMLPFMVLGIDGTARALQARRRAGVARAVTLTAVSSALIVLAGDPRAITTAVIVAAVFLLARGLAGRSVRAAWRLVVALGGAAVLAAGLSGVQWLPGLQFLRASQRGAGAFSQFGNGSIPLGQLGQLLVLPYALGGNDRVGLARYEGPQNLAELAVGVGLVALVAFFVYLPELLRPLAARLSRAAPATGGKPSPEARDGAADWARSSAPVARYWAELDRAAGPGSPRRLGVWYVLVVVGALLAAGTTTPLGDVLSRIPLYDGERLPGRNVAMLDLALCVLLGFLVDDVLARRPGALRSRAGKLLGLVPLVATAGLSVAARIDPSGVLGAVGLVGGPSSNDFLSRQDVYFAVMIVVALAVAVFVIGSGRRLAPVLLAGAVGLDLAVTAVGSSFVTMPVSAVAGSTPQSVEVAALAHGGRMALFNPYIHSILAEPAYISDSALTDLNVVRGLPSVQGYGSIVDGTYDRATGTHGLETLAPSALRNGTFDALDLSVLFTLPLYLDEAIPPHANIPVAGGPAAYGSGAAGIAPDAPNPAPLAGGPWPIGPGGSRDWRLPDVRNVIRVIVVVHAPGHAPPRDVGIAVGSGATAASIQRVPVVNAQAVAFLSAPTPAEVVHVVAPRGERVVVGAVIAVTSHPDQRLLLDGALQGYLAADHWTYAGHVGPLIAFVDQRSAGAAWLQPPGLAAPQPLRAVPGAVRVVPASATRPEQEIVHARSSERLVRATSYEPGWTARVVPLAGGVARSVAAGRFGPVQSILLGSGSWRVSWVYAPRSDVIGERVSEATAALLAIGALAGAALVLRRGRRSARRARHRRGRPVAADTGGAP